MADFEDINDFDKAKAEARKSYNSLTLREMVEKMKEFGEAKEDLEAQLKIVNAHYDVLRMEIIPEKMDNDGVENVKYDGIGRISLTADMFVATADKEGLFNWFKTNGLEDLIQPTVNASTLKAFVKRRIVDGKEYPTEFLRVTPFTRASITKK